MSELPPGWVETTLGEICLPVSKVDPRKDPGAEFTYIDIGGIDGLRIADTKRLTGSQAPSRARQLVQAGDTVLSTVRTYLRKTALVPTDLDGAVASTGFCVLRPADGVEARYVFHRVTTNDFVSAVSPLQTGSSYPAVRDRDVLAQVIELPSLNEQRRIVAAIEEHLSRLDAADASLAAALRWLEGLRRSVLDEVAAAAMTRWELEVVTQVCSSITNGNTPPAQTMSAGTGEVPFIKVYNLTTDGSLDFSKRPTFIDRETHEQRLRKSRLLPGDVLINIVGPPLGKVSVVPATYPEWNTNQAVVAFRPHVEHLSSELLAIWLQSRRVMQPLLSTAKATAGQFNLSISACRRLEVPVPPLEEQRRIVQEVEERLSRIDAMRASIERAQRRSQTLRAAILERAFSGELVPQDPTDEPAEALLARIRAERDASPVSSGRGRESG